MSRGLDSPTSLASVATDLVSKGYHWVARYYFKVSKFKDQLTKPEAQALSKAGLYIVSVFESGFPTSVKYFTAAQAHDDASVAYARAKAAGQPDGTAIYFAVDFDAEAGDLPTIKSYFETVVALMAKLGTYEVDAYGSGAVIEYLKGLGLIKKGWLAQSRGWSKYEDESLRAEIVQGGEMNVLGRDIDVDESNGNAGGWKCSKK